MHYKYLKVRIDNRVGWLEYNYPPINAFNWDMLREVPAALQALLDEPQVRVLVIASAIEKYFSVGADLKVFDGIGSKGMADWVSICHGLVSKMRRARKPLLWPLSMELLRVAASRWYCIATFALPLPMLASASPRLTSDSYPRLGPPKRLLGF